MNKVTLGTFRATDRMRQLVNQVLDTGRLSYGPLSGEFEARFALQHDCRFGILANSGTSALQAGLQAMKELYGWEDGDEVLVPALTFVATVNVCYHCRLTPVLVDIDPDDYAINPFAIAAKITPKTRCIIPVHPFGQPANMPAIMEIAAAYDLKVMEDSCESMFVRTAERSVGSWGECAAFSTYVAHLITTGVGGLVTTSDEKLALRVRSLVNHGIDVDELPTSSHYDHTHLARAFRFTAIGHSFRVSELESALGIPQLETWWEMLEQRQANATYYSYGLADLEEYLQLPYTRMDTEHAFMVYPLVLRQEKKHSLMRYLAENGVEVRDMLPLTTQPCYNWHATDYPCANWINESGLYVGCHQDLHITAKDYFLEVIHDYFQKHAKSS